MIDISNATGRVVIDFSNDTDPNDPEALVEAVRAQGDTLTEAVENLVTRFRELQELAFNELREYGVIRTPRDEGDVS
jgi:hypothetical protein